MKELSTKRSVRSLFKKLPLEFLIIAGLFIAALLLFALIVHEVTIEKENEFDNRVIHFFSPYSAEPFIRLMKFFTFFGSGNFLIPAYIILIAYLLIKRQIMISLRIGIIVITSTVLSQTTKRIFQRSRPDLPLIESLKTYSFPSGHALSSFIFCSILAYLIWRAGIQTVWKLIFCFLLLLFSMTIGLSRVILRMHYPTDVLAGFCLGFIWVILSFYLLNRIQFKSENSINVPVKK